MPVYKLKPTGSIMSDLGQKSRLLSYIEESGGLIKDDGLYFLTKTEARDFNLEFSQEDLPLLVQVPGTSEV